MLLDASRDKAMILIAKRAAVSRMQSCCTAMAGASPATHVHAMDHTDLCLTKSHQAILAMKNAL